MRKENYPSRPLEEGECTRKEKGACFGVTQSDFVRGTANRVWCTEDVRESVEWIWTLITFSFKVLHYQLYIRMQFSRKVEEIPKISHRATDLRSRLSAEPPASAEGAHTLHHNSVSQPPQPKFRMDGTCGAVSGGEGSFYDRKPSVEFMPPTPDWGYLAQVNEKFRNVLTWEMERIVGEPAHRAMFRCTPGRPSLFALVVELAANPRLLHVGTNNLDLRKVCKYPVILFRVAFAPLLT